jgi:hypothetical protein
LADLGADGESAFGLSPLVAPADMVGDRVLLSGVAGVVTADEYEVPQSGEFTLDPVQPRTVGRSEDEFDLVGLAPVSDLGLLVRGVVVADDVELAVRELTTKLAQEVQELGPAFAVTDPVEQRIKPTRFIISTFHDEALGDARDHDLPQQY